MQQQIKAKLKALQAALAVEDWTKVEQSDQALKSELMALSKKVNRDNLEEWYALLHLVDKSYQHLIAATQHHPQTLMEQLTDLRNQVRADHAYRDSK